MAWTGTPYTNFLIVAAAISTASALYVWLRRPVPGNKAAVLIALASTEWMVGYALELGSTDVLTKDFWNKMQYMGIVIVPAAWLAFTLQYTGREKCLTRRTLILLGIEPLATLLLVFTNEAHGLIWERTVPDTGDPFSVLVRPHGTGYWVHSVYSYALSLIAVFLLAQMLIRSRHLYGRQASLLLSAASLPLLGSMLVIFGLNPLPDLDLTPLAVAMSSLILTWSLFRLRVGDIVPVAREVVVESMSDGVIVLDEQNRIVDLNAVAQHIIDHTGSEMIGRSVEQVWPDWPGLIGHSCDGTGIREEVVLGKGDAHSTYDVRVSHIVDWRGRVTSRVLVLRDITERKQAEEALRQRTAQLETLREVGLELTAQLDLDALLHSIVSRAMELLEGIVGGLSLHRPERDVLEAVTAVGDATVPIGSTFRRGEGFSGKIWETGEPLVVDDYQRWEGRTARYDGLSIGAVVGVPIRWGEEFLGTLIVEADAPCTFSPADAELLRLFATHAAIAIRNVRLFETERKRVTQLAVVNQVARKAASILDPDQLLQEIVNAIQQGCEYHNLTLFLLDETASELEMKAIAGGFKDLVTPSYRQAVGVGMVGWTAKTGRPILANDVSREPRYIFGFLEEVLTKSELCVPLKLADQVIGVLDVQDAQLDAFDGTELMAMETLADQIVVALETARLFQAEREQRELAEALEEAAATVSSTLQLDEVLDRILEQVEQVVAGDAFNVMLVEDNVARVVRWRGYEHLDIESHVRRIAVPITDYPNLTKMTQSGKPIVVPDTVADPDWVLSEGREWRRSYVAAPIQVGGVAVGFLNVNGTRPGQFGPADARRLQAFADHTATAVENARLHQEVLDHAEQLERRVQERTAQLAAQYARLEAILSSTADGIVVTDAVGEILQANPVAHTWLTRALSPGDADRLRGQCRNWLDRWGSGRRECWN